MSQTSGWQLFRKRIAPVAFLFALFVLGTQTCRSEATSEVTLAFGFGAAGAQVRALSVEVARDADVVATFSRRFGPDGTARPAAFAVKLDHGSYRLRIELATDAGPVVVTRAAEVQGQGTITVELERELIR